MDQKSLFVGANRRQDAANLTDLEGMHIPVLEAPEAVRRGEPFHVRIHLMGRHAHPNQRDHHVQFIDLYADDTYLARASLTPVVTDPDVTFSVSLTGPVDELRAYARCNLHGLWIGQKPISVRIEAPASPSRGM